MKQQLIATTAAVICLFVLYFGGRTHPNQATSKEKAVAISSEPVSSEVLLNDAKIAIKAADKASIEVLEKQLASTQGNEKREVLKKISSEWNKLGNFAAGGVYAQQIAELTPSDTSWAIAGTTYAIGFKKMKDETVREFCTKRAIKAFEAAISLNPSVSDSKINLALCYVEGAGAQPMKGIKMLTALADKEPNNVGLFLTLGQMAITTGQHEKAIGRFEHIIQIDPKNEEAYCLIAQEYETINKMAEAKNAYAKCAELTKNQNLKKQATDIVKNLK